MNDRIIKLKLYNWKYLENWNYIKLKNPNIIDFNNEYNYNLYKILYDYIINNNINIIMCVFIENYYYNTTDYTIFIINDYEEINKSKFKNFNLINICNNRPELIESLLIEI